jgi:hypothetical protein
MFNADSHLLPIAYGPKRPVRKLFVQVFVHRIEFGSIAATQERRRLEVRHGFKLAVSPADHQSVTLRDFTRKGTQSQHRAAGRWSSRGCHSTFATTRRDRPQLCA